MKSGVCVNGPIPPSRQDSANGWAAMPTTAGSKSSRMRWSRSSQDSYGTCPPPVADQYQPVKFRCPRYEGNDRDGGAASNITDHITDSGPSRRTPSDPTSRTQ
ncbi:hypothetical protein AQI70_14715 [Streptomyces curacoi]|uniref:Uncharacterized protein n=1 Tax=Streptomyces curacoi TaxID=146536 RepID=A0A117PAT0_9ACTN|nr:hypothetical protein AQI70_14715 [Streptomyces curacoi]